jgi:hypothetical protein
MAHSALSKNAQLAVFIFPLLVLVSSFSLYIYNTESYHKLFGILEQGIFEWAQFVCYGLSSYIGLTTFFAYKRHSPTSIQKYIFLAFATGCAFIALEEVSYGQHIFKWATPDWISNSNLQRETNLHNLAAIQGNNIQVKAFIFVGWFGSLAWICRRALSNISLSDFILPEWFVSSYFFPLAIFYTQLLYVFHWGNNHQETFETILSFGFVGVAVINLLKVKNKAYVNHHQP